MLRSSRLAFRGRVEGVVDGTARLVGELVHPAEQPNADALATKLVGLAADGALEQAEEAMDLVVRAGPVLAAEGVQGQHRDTAPDGVAEDLADGFHAGGMSVELRQALLAGPAAVAVHDDRDVTRQLVRRQECRLSRAVVRRGRRFDRGRGGHRRRRRFVSGRGRVGRPGQRYAAH